MATAAQKVTAARTALIYDQPFWGVLALRLKPVETRDVPMGATDGTHLFYNPEYVERIPFDELVGLIAEEVGHCAMGHMWRRDGRDPKEWNVAADLSLAPILRDAGFNTGDMLHDAQYAGKSAEWIYARRQQPQQPKSQPKSGGQQSGKSGQPQSGANGQQQQGQSEAQSGRVEVLDPPKSNGSEQSDSADNSEESWKQAVQQAAVASKGRGTKSAGAQRLIAESGKTRVDWRSTLRRFVQQTAKSDYSFRRPNTRYLARGLYMPSLISDEMPAMAVCVDTSGSIDAVMLNNFQAEIRAIADEMSPARIHVIYCDAEVNAIETFERGDVVTLSAKGGGGTAFGPAIDAVEALDDEIACCAYLTDLAGSHRAEPPAFPILWVATDTRYAKTYPVPYGEVVTAED